MQRPVDISYRYGYHTRIMGTLVLVLLCAVAVVRWWPPAPSNEPASLPVTTRGEMIEIEEIRPTRQSGDVKPPPPAPIPPIVVADDVILEQEEFDLSDAFLPLEIPGATVPAPGTDAEEKVVFEGPKPIRVVEPEYTRAAHRRKVRAEVVVGVKIDEQGRVQEAWVMKRYLLGEENEPREVDELGYGLEEAAMAAAERCLFRPARRNGQPVASETTLGFGFGV